MKWRIVEDDAERSEAMHHAIDQVLTEKVSRTQEPVLRFWYRGNEAIPFGRFQSYADEIQEEFVDSEGIEPVRRITGGGAMFVQPGKVITYSMYLPRSEVEGSIEESYRRLDSWSRRALQRLGLEVEHEPLNDIVHPDGKIGGAAQLRSGDAVLHHTTMSYDLDTRRMLKALRIGKEKVSDKAIKSAEKRVALIRDHLDLERSEIIEEMVETFLDDREGVRGEMEDDEIGEAEKLAAEKFSTDEWNRKM